MSQFNPVEVAFQVLNMHGIFPDMQCTYVNQVCMHANYQLYLMNLEELKKNEILSNENRKLHYELRKSHNVIRDLQNFAISTSNQGQNTHNGALVRGRHAKKN